MVKEKITKQNLNKNLKQLEAISKWFEDQQEIDVEVGLKKVKEALQLLKASKDRLRAIENEFEEIKKEIETEEEIDN